MSCSKPSETGNNGLRRAAHRNAHSDGNWLACHNFPPYEAQVRREKDWWGVITFIKGHMQISPCRAHGVILPYCWNCPRVCRNFSASKRNLTPINFVGVWRKSCKFQKILKNDLPVSYVCSRVSTTHVVGLRGFQSCHPVKLTSAKPNSKS